MDNLKLEKVIYKYKDKEVELKVDYNDKEIYLTAKEISVLFGKNKKTIKNKIYDKNIQLYPIFGTTETNISITADDGKTYKTNIYNSKIIYALGLKYKSEIIMDLKEFVDNLFKENDNVLIDNLSLNEANNYDIVKYDNGEIIIEVNVSIKEETV